MNNFNNNYSNRNNYGRQSANYGRSGSNYKGYSARPANAPRYKKSGAKFTTIAKANRDGESLKSAGLMAVNAWVKTRQGLIKITAFGYDVVKGKTCEWHKAVAEVVNLGTGQNAKYPVLINATKHKMAIKELGLLVTANGGGTTRSGRHVSGSVVSLKKG